MNDFNYCIFHSRYMYFFYENHQNVMETVTRDRLLSSVSGLEKIEHGPDDLGPAIR